MQLGRAELTPLATRNIKMHRGLKGEFTGLYTAKNPHNGQSGYVLFVYEWEKRDVVKEELWTDNRALFAGEDALDESPSATLDAHADDLGPVPPGELGAAAACVYCVYGDD